MQRRSIKRASSYFFCDEERLAVSSRCFQAVDERRMNQRRDDDDDERDRSLASSTAAFDFVASKGHRFSAHYDDGVKVNWNLMTLW